jgi:hypothetical protein
MARDLKGTTEIEALVFSLENELDLTTSNHLSLLV